MILRKTLGAICVVGWVSILPILAQDGRQFLGIFGKPLEVVDTSKLTDIENKRIELGRTLYFEKRLSRDNSISCNSCHDTQAYGVDGKDFSVGFENHLTGRNSPTSFNAFLHFVQFWDGRAKDVEEQAKGPILAAGEMAMPSSDEVISKLSGIQGYPSLFAEAFPGEDNPLNYDNVGKAIGAYERLFVTPSRFDRALAGETSALTEREYQGLTKFVVNGCIACHTGNLLGGTLYQKLGLVKPWANQKDQGRYDLTKKEEDRMMFKVPALRNIEKTAPYFHDASAKTLKEAIQLMGSHQMGREISDADAEDIEIFLKSLTGSLPAGVGDAPKSFPGLPAGQ